MRPHESLEENLAPFLLREPNGFIEMQELLSALSERGRAFLLIFLCLPFSQPLQVPGFSIPFGLIITWLGLRTAFDSPLWLPKFLQKKRFPAHKIQFLIKKCLACLNGIRRFLHPRLEGLATKRGMQTLNGLIVCFLGIFLALPFPIPFSNILAAWGIIFIALGILENDGLFIILGYIGALATLAVIIGIIITIRKII